MTEPHAPSVRECENPISALANRIRSNIASLPERIDGMGWEFYLPDPLPDELDPVDETPALRGTELEFVFRPKTAGDDAICANCGCPQSLHDEATGECPPLYDDSPCPVSDPCCEGGDGDCHDACQPPRRTDDRRRDDAMRLARAERRGAELHLMAASRPIAHRGDTLNAGTINVRLFAPMEGVVGVEVVHFKGAAEREPRLELNRLPVEPAIAEDDGAWSFASGPLAARAQKTGPWRLDFAADGRVLTSSGFRGMGRALDRRDGASYMSDSLTLGVGECVYGLGERFAAYVKNGQQVDIWNADGGTKLRRRTSKQIACCSAS